MTDPAFLTAVDQLSLLRRKKLGAEELLEACLAQIQRTNRAVNALVTLDPEGARAAARAADSARVKGREPGLLEGLPLAVKDIFETKGLKTTFGSPSYRDHIPAADHLIVARERAAGAIILGKSNTPEFATGGQTWNRLFGMTRNPFDPAKSVNGSSGGGAAALACGMVSLADGSDVGGSLRSPASWCDVVGFRPSPGRVPGHPSRAAWIDMHTPGPMARSVGDIALFMQAIAGPDRRAPTSLDEPGSIFAQDLSRNFKGCRLAWGLDPAWPLAPAVARHFQVQRRFFEDLGCAVIETAPDLSGIITVYDAIRGLEAAIDHGEEFGGAPEALCRVLRLTVERGLALTAAELRAAEVLRSQLYDGICRFFDEVDFLVWPVNQMEVFGIEDPNPEDDAHWLSVKSQPVLGLPAISVPAGADETGLPAGIQITGPPRGDVAVLQLAHAFETARGGPAARLPLPLSVTGAK